ncbi:UDP-glucuronosyl/UDP-glucosyltransferase [Macleaya cordata]|uniref:UDP-glucuronosyl/UDP-glucosyltransferase n=1 Tax=Macleaya cordata TaxID=56857 RepID=A0A200QJU3_MACCD|nr:UDP-glucuronosyl/UDP-glucosyltransferase [Macleaya cordata]
MEMEKFGAHVMVLPGQAQGHMNPMLQFSKRLASKGLKVTVATTLANIKIMKAQIGSIRIEPIYDDSGEGGIAGPGGYKGFFERFRVTGSWNLSEFVEEQKMTKYPVKALVYDANLPWALDVAKHLYAWVAACGITKNAVDGFKFGAVTVPRSEVDWEAMASTDRRSNLPSSMYLDKRVQEDGFHLFRPDAEACMDWLNKKEHGSVAYVSFGSAAKLSTKQMEELAWGLEQSNYNFLWVVRESEENNLPLNFIASTGLVVKWCCQLDRGFSSAGNRMFHNTLWMEFNNGGTELGSVAMPRFLDQFSDAKFVKEVWEVGINSTKG